MQKTKSIVFASGEKEPGKGGSGFKKLVEATSPGGPVILNTDIVAVVSHHPEGGVRDKARELNVPFIHFPKPWDEAGYQKIMRETGAEFALLSGWLKEAKGLDPRKTINIHPGSTRRFGGPGMYKHHVHEAVHAALKKGEITHSAVTMHFATDKYDRGPIFFQKKVLLEPDDTPETIQKKVNIVEHAFQAWVTNLVVTGQISWDGHDPASLVVPADYDYLSDII